MHIIAVLLVSLFAPAVLAQPCDPAQTDEVCPDTTDWHRYFPLDVGNVWHYYEHLIEEPENRWSWTITGEAEVEGQTYVTLERCDDLPDGSAACEPPVLLRYDDEHAMVVRREEGGETWWRQLPCRMDADFNAFYECTGPGTEDAFLNPRGSYGATVSVPPDEVSGDTRKYFEVFVGTGPSMYAGLGMTDYFIELQAEAPELVYAFVGGEQVGTPAFASCDPADSDILCPDTTDWRSYLPPLAVGNQWQYDYEGFCSEVDPCRRGREVVGREVIEGVEHFLVRRCSQFIDGNVTCREPLVVSGEGSSAEACRLSLPFNYSGTVECDDTGFYFETYGRYADDFDLGEGPSLTGSVKEVVIEGSGITYFAGIGWTEALGDGSKFGEALVYARIDGVEYGTPAFVFPTSSEPEAAQPVATGFTSAFPNPARGSMQAQYALASPQRVTLELIDLLGRRVRETEVGPQAVGPHDVRVDLGGLRPGLYVLRLRGDAGAEATRRVVVVR